MLKVLVTVFLVSSLGMAAGTVTGKIEFKGTAPKMDPLKMNADPFCQKAHEGQKVLSDDIQYNANKTLGQVFVYVKEGVKKEAVPAAPTEPVNFDQVGCLYKPKVVGLRAGQTLRITNSDPTLHNVHAVPKTNSGFNIGMPTKGNIKEQKFAQPELGIRIKCEVHSWMTAYINVVDHPYFAVSDDQGNYTISNLPPGDYTIEAFHHNSKLGSKTQKVSVKDNKIETVNFSY
jgi:plastocyanin